MTDRYVQTESEESSYDAFVRLVGTISVIALSYMAMAYDPLVLFVTLHPETWVVLIAFIFYLGRSRYYTLFDLRRFKRLFNTNDEPLTMLSRNRDYLGKYNTKLLFPIINKFRLKEQFDEWKVPNPELYAVISEESEIDAFIDRAKSDKRMQQGFAIKPSESYGGRGIVLVKKIEGGYFIIGDEKYHDDAVRDHIRKILQGEYLTSQTNSISDIVLIEEKIVADKRFGALGIGLPDVRVILFLGIPVMVMARIPTKESDGLANLKQGAIGAAISIKTGTIYRAEWKRNQVDIHPDTHMELTGFKFENWNEFLAIACLAQKSTGLGYAGVDLVLDQSGKIFVLEVNKRPGLEIQNINLKGLLARLEQIEEMGLDAMDLSPLRSAAIGRELAEKYWEVDL
jgi:alpha-L-glutamate ligase-like protein